MSEPPLPFALPGLLGAVLEAAAHGGLGVIVTRLRDPIENVFVSARAAEMLGRDVQEVLRARSPLEFVAEEERAALADMLARRRAGEPMPDRLETVFAPKAGGRLPVELARCGLEVDGVPCTVTLIRDLSPQKKIEDGLRRSEARLRTLIESAPDGIVLSRDRNIVYANPAAAALLGVGHPSELTGRSFAEFLHPQDFAMMGDRVASLEAGGPPQGPREYRARSATGEAVVVEVTSVVFDDDDGPAVVGFARDVTESRRLQAQLVRADRLAALGTMAAGVAHEINNPLTFMMLGLDAIEHRLQRPETDLDAVRGTLADVRHGVERVAAIVRQLHAFSRSESSAGRGPASVPAVLEAVAQMAGHEIRQYGRLELDIEVGLPLVRGEPSQLEQVFLNLLLNAAQALDVVRGEGMILVSAALVDGAVEVAVKDDGAGIPESELAHVFDPFFTTKPVGAGTGLGLSICHSIVTSIGGSITVESGVGEGTTVRVRLSAFRRRVRTTTPPRSVSPEPGERLQILVADDEAPFLRALERILSADHHVVTCSSGDDAWTLLEEADPDVILLDVMMPGLSGMEVYERLCDEREELTSRVVFMTGGVARAEVGRFLAQVRRPILRKPFGAMQLHALLRRLREV